MKKYIYPLLIILFSMSLTPIMSQNEQADAIIGQWFNQEKDGKVEIYKEDGKYFGRIIWVKPNEDGSEKKDVHNPKKEMREKTIYGLVVLKNFNYKGKQWEDGTIYDPKSGKTYSCIMNLDSPNELRIRGYIGVSWIGRTTHWTKAE